VIIWLNGAFGAGKTSTAAARAAAVLPRLALEAAADGPSALQA
jgi:hypothetical protein